MATYFLEENFVLRKSRFSTLCISIMVIYYIYYNINIRINLLIHRERHKIRTIYFRATDILLCINFQDELRTNQIFLYFSNTFNLLKLINIS